MRVLYTKVLCLYFCFLFPWLGEAAIYGRDDRVLIENQSLSVINDQAVALIGSMADLESCDNTSCRTHRRWRLFERIEQSRRDGGMAPACVGVRFENLKTLGSASGFLISPTLVMTAGHVAEMDLLSNLYVTFEHRGKSGAPPRFEVYTVKNLKLIGRRFEGLERHDYAIFELDRPVLGIQPLKLKTLVHPATVEVGALGHPQGLPLTFSGVGHWLRTSGTSVFYTNLDLMSGNSGSPVFDTKDGGVVGVHIDGPNDYQIVKGCKQVNHCSLPHCEKGSVQSLPGGEAVMDMGFILKQMAKKGIQIE